MNKLTLLFLSVIMCHCKPGVRLPGTSPSSNPVNAPALSSDGSPAESNPSTPVSKPDPEEEVKATEPAIVGGAYLYCDTAEAKGPAASQSMSVGCRLSQVPDAVWSTSSKQVQVVSMADGSAMNINVLPTVSGSPYQLAFTADPSLQNSMEMAVDIHLPQGQVSMTSTISHFHPKLASLRSMKGVSFIASVGAPGEESTDVKTWNIWMPVKIPQSIANLEPVSDKGPAANPVGVPKTAELTFDGTVCSYKLAATNSTMKLDGSGSGDQAGAYQFASCTKPDWMPGQLIRSKSISLGLVPEPGKSTLTTVGVVLEAAP